MWFPVVFISALDKIGVDVKNPVADFFICFFRVMVCNQNSRLQQNVF